MKLKNQSIFFSMCRTETLLPQALEGTLQVHLRRVLSVRLFNHLNSSLWNELMDGIN